MESDADITGFLARFVRGDRDGSDQAFARIYAALRDLAHAQRARHDRGDSLRTTTLLHEAFVKVFGSGREGWQDRGHFLCFAAAAMRSILIDHVRRKGSRPPASDPVLLDDVAARLEERVHDLAELDRALELLGEKDEQLVRIVELRFFGGLSVRETAEALGLSERTAEREWAVARAWLRRALS